MSNFVAEINKLRNIQQNLDKNENITVDRLTKIDDSQQIMELHSELSESRNLQKEKLQRDTSNIIKPLCKIKDMIKQKDFDGIDLKVVKQEMTLIQDNIYNQKQFTKVSLEFLQKEEDKLIEDVEVFEQKIQDWSKPISNKSTPNKSIVAKRSSCNVPESIAPEVKEYMEYVDTNGGHENGWNLDDHNLFLKYRNKTKTARQLAEVIHGILPDISFEDVIAHENWYVKYLELKDKQKDSIKNWRNSKKVVKPASPKAAIKEQKSVIHTYNDIVIKEEKQFKITTWKAEKRVQVRSQREKQLEDQVKQKQVEKQEEERRKFLKAELQNWKSKKNELLEAEKIKKEFEEQEERKNRAMRANKLIKQFQKQDENFIRQKQLMNGCRPKSSNETIKISRKEAERDPERLLRPTKQWMLRIGSNELKQSQSTLTVQQIPKLRIPEWRKTLT